MGLFSGRRPANLGLRDGRFAPPRRTPNCVSSQADRRNDSQHYIEPLGFAGPPADAWAALIGVIQSMERVKIIAEKPNYLHAEFRTKLMGFVDDAEFCLDEHAGVIHVRSASRLGRRDFGVNRSRIEAIRSRMAAPGA
jgi:uncharacterized protein (DUF1499 family)